jgi:flavorubredoxin
MPATSLFDSPTHKNLLLDESQAGDASVQANQHVILHEGGAMLLDPGGHKVYAKVFSDLAFELGEGAKIERIFLSHQDPDVVAGISQWLRTTDATAHTPALWLRFLPHYGLEAQLAQRIHGLPDWGGTLDLRGLALQILPAHFLHSPGNLQVYDPFSKILYSGDLGASVGAPYVEVPDFDAHLRYMEGFHRRYMSGRGAMKRWARMARTLDVELMAPQHGAFFRGKELFARFIDWCEYLDCGPDCLPAAYSAPV